MLMALPDIFDGSLAKRRTRGDNAALTEGLAQARATTERAVLTEIRLRTATLDENLPAAFVRAFEGAGFPDSWFDLFVRDAAFRLKEEASFERIWNAEQIALVKAITDAYTVALAEIDDRTKRIEQSQTRHTATLQELQGSLHQIPHRLLFVDLYSKMQALRDEFIENQRRIGTLTPGDERVMQLGGRNQGIIDISQQLFFDHICVFGPEDRDDIERKHRQVGLMLMTPPTPVGVEFVMAVVSAREEIFAAIFLALKRLAASS